MISMESFEEYKRALLLEIDPRVVRYSEQPWTLEVNSGEVVYVLVPFVSVVTFYPLE